MPLLRLTIDDIEVEVEEGRTVLQAAMKAGKYIPALCAHPDLPPAPGLKADRTVFLAGKPFDSTGPGSEYQGCGLCAVEIQGVEGLPLSCSLPVREGMVVRTSTPEVQEFRRERLKDILSKHPHACLTCKQREGCSPFESCPNSIPVLERCCSKLGYCELQGVADYVGVRDDIPRYRHRELPVNRGEPLFDQDYNICIGCTRCVRVCRDVRGVGALGFIVRNGEVLAGPIAPTLAESGCKFCGACVEVCPTGALLDRDVKRAEREAALVPCTDACPAGVDVPRYVRLLAEGRFEEALQTVREKAPFPRVLGRVCFHPCEAVCRRGRINEPIAIAALKRAAAELGASAEDPAPAASPTGKKAAVVGSGPAGLTAAYCLARRGHAVTVFEALPEPGGMMRVGIPAYRLPRDVLNSEIDRIREAGVDIKTNSRVESLDGLSAQGFNAVYVATGAHRGLRLGVQGEDSGGVTDCLSFLRDVSEGRKVATGDRVAVIGGGNAAVDAARTALRLGAKDVTVVYRRSREEMPASPEEVEGALEEGVQVLFLAAPSKITPANGKLRLECLRMELGEPDASGRKRPVPVQGSEFESEHDLIIAAIGQAPDVPDGFELDVIGGGRIKIDPATMATNIKGVFAGGDAATGPASVIEAIAAGRKAAVSIDKFLGGSGDIDVEKSRETGEPWLGRDEGFAGRRRAVVPCLPPGERKKSFAEADTGLDAAAGVTEASRCLRCDLRFQIAEAPRPPDEWLAFTRENVEAAPESDGVFRLFDDQKQVIYIGSGPNLRESLEEQMDSIDDWVKKARYLHYEQTLMYTMRESELIQQYLQEHGSMPEGNEEFF